MPALKRPIELVKALAEWGLSYDRIAREIGVRQSSIFRIASGDTKRPKERTEKALRALYAKYIGVEN